MARPRRRHEIRWSVWTFVAPVALVVVAVVVVSVVRGAVDDARTSERAGATTAATTGSTTSGATTGDAAPAKRRTYTVRTGETLSDIAERFDTTVTELVRLNPDLDPDAIQPGQRIRVS